MVAWCSFDGVVLLCEVCRALVLRHKSVFVYRFLIAHPRVFVRSS